VPSIALVNGNWVGELATIPVIMGGTQWLDPPVKLKDEADALLYLGPRDSLIEVEAPREEVDGTPYGKELLRRMKIVGLVLPYIPDAKESAQFSRQDLVTFRRRSTPPKTTDTPLPPRPPSQ